jgi:hypothetical protein
MAARLAIFLSVLMALSLGQQSADRVKAGDRAPDIDWTKIVQSPESAKYHPGLTGQYRYCNSCLRSRRMRRLSASGMR